MKCTLEACPAGFKTCCSNCEAKDVCGDKCPTCEDVISCKYRILPRYVARKRTSYKWLVDVVIIAMLVLLAAWTANLNMMAEDTLNTLAESRAEIDDLRTEVREMDKWVEEEAKVDTAKQENPTGAYLGEYTITYYCPCVKCCGKSDGITKSGVLATEGRTVGADLSVLPLGTVIEIEGIGQRVVEDTGNIKGNHLDVFVDSHTEALKLGRDTRKVYKVE